MYAVKAIYDGTTFKPKQPISVKGRYDVVITFLEPVAEEITGSNQLEKHPRAKFIGSWKDKIWISDDFNEPLEEMGEYME
ncbi:MAG: DUF2281 domain-containing protein [Defluviitaleaceae bacterium]|nr:DUF2281 domain-containing protein [Defluviitaleaceae bacterium]